VTWLKDLKSLQAKVNAKLTEGVSDNAADCEWHRVTTNDANMLSNRLNYLSKDTISRYRPALVELKRSLEAENDKIMLSRQATKVESDALVNRFMSQTTERKGGDSGYPGENTGAQDILRPGHPPNANHRVPKRQSKSLVFTAC